MPHESTPVANTTIIAIDPGRDKCGLAIVQATGDWINIVERRIVAPRSLTAAVEHAIKQYSITQIILGDSTTSQLMAETLRLALPGVSLSLVNEKGSTLEARALYWEANPPRGWRRVVSLSLQEPPEPVDDFAAVVLARRFFAQHGNR